MSIQRRPDKFSSERVTTTKSNTPGVLSYNHRPRPACARVPTTTPCSRPVRSPGDYGNPVFRPVCSHTTTFTLSRARPLVSRPARQLRTPGVPSWMHARRDITGTAGAKASPVPTTSHATAPRWFLYFADCTTGLTPRLLLCSASTQLASDKVRRHTTSAPSDEGASR